MTLYTLVSNPYLRSILWSRFTAKAYAAGYPPSAALRRLIRRYLEHGFDDGDPETQSAKERHQRLASYDKLPLSRHVAVRAPAAYGAYAGQPLTYDVEGMPEDLGALIVSEPFILALLTAERQTWRIVIWPSHAGAFVKGEQYRLPGEYNSPEEAIFALEAALLRGDLAETEGRDTGQTT
jgi:hypothetical protein